MSDYLAIEAVSPEDLQRKVKAALADGWQLQGGVCVVRLPNDDYLYVQALAR